MPKAVGAVVAAAGACNLINSLAWLGAPQWAARLPQEFAIPTLVGELALALWLLVFGVREFSPRPEAAAIATSPPQNR